MADDEIGEVRQPLNFAQGFGRTLEAAEEIVEGADHQKFGRIRFLEPPPIGHESAVEILNHRPHRNDQHHRCHDRDGLRPIGDGTIDVVMRAHERIEERERPETDQGEFVAVERPLGCQRQEIIDDRETRRRDPQSHDIVNVQAMHRGVVHPGHGIGQDEVPEGVVEHGPNVRGG